MTSSLRVELGSRSYDIAIGEGLIGRAGELMSPLLKRKKTIIICDDTVAKLYLETLQASLTAQGITHNAVVLPHGEQTKSFSELEKLMEKLLDFAPDRNVTLIALGGGVIGDITGFAASILLRGVDFIQIPTTLLAQVDSSVGGKTGINTRHGKNLIGSFYQPRLVIADTAALLTLPRRELLAGYAEVVKYGVICDRQFFTWLEENGEQALAGDTQKLAHIVRASCKSKAEVVACDERESGVRAILNFGHTLGHALEAETGYSDKLLHGEAVSVGMMLAMKLSVMRGLSTDKDLERLKNHLAKAGMPAVLSDVKQTFDAEKLIEHCYHDKKAKDGGLTFVLAKGIGKTVICDDITRQELQQLLVNA
ncbi:MAG TPA: 3-dehydroquinate synthase [Rickettsiales bacterium]|nr:3-dehydroquinate synthase [Rickettsiales bacterium]